MNCAGEARKLADFIGRLDSFTTNYSGGTFRYAHIGALFTDIVLQAGLNYTTVVRPRVKRILLEYPEAITCRKVLELIQEKGLPNILSWNHPVKLHRFEALLSFCIDHEIDSCSDLKIFLTNKTNREALLGLKGFGPKTLDYLLKLLNFDTVAVDRHIYSFVELANIETKDYHHTKKIVEHAADFLKIPRATIDYSIWLYMSEKQGSRKQLATQLNMNI